MADTGHWTFIKDFDPLEWVGFVYLITNLTTGQKYIGKKFFASTTHVKIKDRKNRKKVVKESNWKKYTGSSRQLTEDIELLGKDKFQFEILSLHESRSSLAWREVEMIVKNDALRAKLPNGEQAYYNGLCPPIRFTVLSESKKERDYRI
jgi:phage-related protein